MNLTRFKLPKRNDVQFRSIREFKVGKKLGEGAFSKVYEAMHFLGGRKFAIKIVNFERLGTLDQENVQKEIEAHKNFDHKNIVKLVDFFQEDKKVYIVLELCENGNLFQRLKNKKNKVSLNDLRKFYQQTCYALQYIHNKKYIVRDIKPENLLIDKHNNIKLCDFGWIADLTQDDEFRKIKAGTFAYMSPESLQGKLQDIESDVWALGILLYEFFHLKDPYGGLNCQQQLEYIRQKNIEFNYKRIPILAQNLVLKILQQDVDKRPTIQQILSDEFFYKQCEDPREIYQQNPLDQFPHLKDLYWNSDEIDGLFKEPENLFTKYQKKDMRKQNQENLKEVSKKYGVTFNSKKKIQLNLQTSFSTNKIPMSQDSSKNSDSSYHCSTHSEPVHIDQKNHFKSYSKLNKLYNTSEGINSSYSNQKVYKKQKIKVQGSTSNLDSYYHWNDHRLASQDHYQQSSRSHNKSYTKIHNKSQNLGSTPQKIYKTHSTRRIVINKQLNFDDDILGQKNLKFTKNQLKDLPPVQNKQMNFKKKKKSRDNMLQSEKGRMKAT